MNEEGHERATPPPDPAPSQPESASSRRLRCVLTTLRFIVSLIRRSLRSQFFLAGLFAVLNAAFFIFTVIVVYSSNDPEAGMAFALIAYLNYPVWLLFQLGTVGLLLAGIVSEALWFCYGFVLQSLFVVRRPAGRIRVGIGVLLAAFLCAIPEVTFRMLKPAWEQNWFRGSIIGTASASGRAKAVRYVSEAIRLSPKDNPELRAMWGYLGGLHLNQEDYKQAEASFKAELALLQAQKNPKPDELAGAYGGLRMVYYRTGNLQGQKECLRKEIEFCRAARGPDSPAENSLWYDLAQVTHDSGDSRQAQALLDRAINMEAARHDPAAPIGYWKRKLHDWKNE